MNHIERITSLHEETRRLIAQIRDNDERAKAIAAEFFADCIKNKKILEIGGREFCVGVFETGNVNLACLRDIKTNTFMYVNYTDIVSMKMKVKG